MAGKLEGYVDVATRIGQFYEKFPDGSIQTDLVKFDDDGLVIFKATVYRDPDDHCPTTGWAYEREGSSNITKTSVVEVGETSAIGRALANMGFATKEEHRPSREEMEKVDRMNALLESLVKDIKVVAAKKELSEEQKKYVANHLDRLTIPKAEALLKKIKEAPDMEDVGTPPPKDQQTE